MTRSRRFLTHPKTSKAWVALVIVGAAVGCAPDLSVPNTANITCSTDAQCPESLRCSASLGVCVPGTANQAPSVSTSPVARTLGVVSLAARVFDAEGDDVDLGASMRVGGESYAIAVTPATVAGSPDGTAVDLTFDAATHLGDNSYREGLVVELVPRDATGIGATYQTEPFAVGNDAPTVGEFFVSGAGGVLNLSLLLRDSSSDDVYVSALEYSTDGFATHTAVPIDALNLPGLPALLATSADGVEHTLQWNSALTAALASTTLQLRVNVRDTLGAESAGLDSLSFAFDNAPTLGLIAHPVTGRLLTSASFTARVGDPNIPLSETLAVDLEWTADDASSPQALWQPLTPESSSDGITGITQPGDLTIVWDVLADAGTPPLSVALLDTSDGALPPVSAVNYVAGLSVRGVARDSANLESAPVLLSVEPLGNDAPIAEVAGVSNNARNQVPIQVRVSDTSFDPADVEVQFRLDGETDFRNAALVLSNSEALATSPTGVLHLLLWDSSAPLHSDPTVPQGIGISLQSDVEVRVRAIDYAGATSGTRYFGPWATTTTLPEVANQSPPRVDGIELSRLLVSGGSSPVPITYRVIDAESDLVDVRFELSSDNGATWFPCVHYPSAQSEPPVGLMSAPAPGIAHTFIWDPTGEALSQAETLLLRVLASDGKHPDVTQALRSLPQIPRPSAEPPNEVKVVDQELVFLGGGVSRARLALGDLNGDAITDIVSAEDTGPTMQVHLGLGQDGIGSGAFDPLDPGDWFALPAAAADIELFDTNADGILDLVSGNLDGTFTRLLGLGSNGVGDGTFEAVLPGHPFFGSGAPISSMIAGDFTGDGVFDLAATRTDDSLVVMRGVSDGTFIEAATTLVGAQPYSLAVADFDADGALDFVVPCADDAEVQLWLNRLSAPVPALEAGPPLSAPGSPRHVALLDYNVDGHIDMAVTSDGALLLYRGRLDPPYFEFDDSLESVAQSGALVVGDINADGAGDLVVAENGNSLERAVSVHSGLGDGFSPLMALTSAYSSWARDVAVGDFNADALADLAYLEVTSYGSFHYFRALTPEPQALLSTQMYAPFQAIAPESDTWSLVATRLRAGDFDGDGIWDLAVASPNYAATLGIGVMRGSGAMGLGNGTFETPVPHFVAHNVSIFETADFNGDALYDLAFVANSGTSYSLAVALASGMGEFSAPTLVDLGGTAGALFLRDATHDGISDILVSRGSSLRLFAGIGDGTFAAPSTLATGGATPVTALVSDFDDDGYVDIIVNKPVSGSWLLRGLGSGTFAAAALISNVAVGPSAMVVDVNQDGVEDIVNGGGGFIATPLGVYLGQGTGGVGNATFANVQTYSSGVSATLAGVTLGDVSGDGILDIVGYFSDETQVVVYAGESTRGMPSGTFAAGEVVLNTPGMTRTVSAVLRDFNGDGYADLAAGNAASSVIAWWFGQRQHLEAYTQVVWPSVRADSTKATVAAWGFAPSQTSGTLGAYGPARITVRPPHLAAHGQLDFFHELRASGLSLPPVQSALTKPYLVEGLETLARVPPKVGFEAQGAPLRVGDPLGELDLSSADVALQRGLVVSLPLAGNARFDDLVGDIHVYQQTRSLRADSEGYLARLAQSDGSYTDQVVYDYAWQALSLDVDSDFSTGTGARYYLELMPLAGSKGSDLARGVVHVLLDAPGTLQAFWAP